VNTRIEESGFWQRLADRCDESLTPKNILPFEVFFKPIELL
jgi:hypothetical protein